MANKQWSQKYKKCKTCGTIKKPHRSRGLCSPCYSRYLVKKRKEKRGKIASAVNEIFCRPLEWTTKKIQAEANALIVWAHKDDSIVFEMFHCKRPHPYTREVMYKLADKDINFRHAFDLARELVRGRREQGSCVGTMNASSVQYYHGFYDRNNYRDNMSFTSYKDERKKVEDTADVSKQKQAITHSKQFVDDAKKVIAKKKKANKDEENND